MGAAGGLCILGKWDLLTSLRASDAGSFQPAQLGSHTLVACWKRFQIGNICSYSLYTKAVVNCVLLTVVFVGEKSSESHSSTMAEGCCVA